MTQTRQQAKREWAESRIAHFRKQGIVNPVVVMPVFVEDEHGVWEPTDEVIIEGNNPDWCSVAVVSVNSIHIDGFEIDEFRSALIRRKTVGTNERYQAGMNLNGKIYIVESTTPVNPADLNAGIKYQNKAAVEHNLPSQIGGKDIYRKAMFTTDDTIKDTIIPADNLDSVYEKIAELKVLASKPQSNALKNASQKVVGKK